MTTSFDGDIKFGNSAVPLGGTIHYGNRGVLGQATSFNPDADQNGLWIEGTHDGESTGLFMNGSVMCLWSPGDNDLLRVYDEDLFGSPNTQPLFVIRGNGNVALNNATGVTTIVLDNEAGRITIRGTTLNVPDTVFEPDFELKPLQELEAYIRRHKHLPDIPSAREVHESGVDLGEFSMALLKKIEELSLYVLGQQKLIEAQGERIAELARAAGAPTAP